MKGKNGWLVITRVPGEELHLYYGGKLIGRVLISNVKKRKVRIAFKGEVEVWRSEISRVIEASRKKE